MATTINPIDRDDLDIIYKDPRYKDLRPLIEYIFEVLDQIRADNDANH